jgi:hypothetical protein
VLLTCAVDGVYLNPPLRERETARAMMMIKVMTDITMENTTHFRRPHEQQQQPRLS